jgi:hypothetical protein
MSPKTFGKEKAKLDVSWWVLPAPSMEAQLAKTRKALGCTESDLFAEIRPGLMTVSVGQANDPMWWWGRRLVVSGSVACTMHAAIWQLIQMEGKEWWTSASRALCNQLAKLLGIKEGVAYTQVDPDAPLVAALDLAGDSTWACGPELLPPSWVPGNAIPVDCGIARLAEEAGGSSTVSTLSPTKRKNKYKWEPNEGTIEALFINLPMHGQRHPGKNDLNRPITLKLKALRAFATSVSELPGDESAGHAYRQAVCWTMSTQSLKLVLSAAGNQDVALHKLTGIGLLADGVLAMRPDSASTPIQPTPLTMKLIAASGLPKLSQKRKKRGHASAGHQSEEAVQDELVSGSVAGVQIMDVRNPGLVKSVHHPSMAVSLDGVCYLLASDPLAAGRCEYRGLCLVEQKSAHAIASVAVQERIQLDEGFFKIVDLTELDQAALDTFHRAVVDWKHSSQMVHGCGVTKLTTALYTLAPGVDGIVSAIRLFLFPAGIIEEYNAVFHSYILNTMPWFLPSNAAPSMECIERALGLKVGGDSGRGTLPKKLGTKQAVLRMALDARGIARLTNELHAAGKPPPIRCLRIIGGNAAAWNWIKGSECSA